VQTAALNKRLSEAEADIESARASTEDRLQAQITNQGQALNTRITEVETTAEEARAQTQEALITQFTAADGVIHTALSNRITLVETSAQSAIASNTDMLLTHIDDSVGVVQQQVNTKVTANQAQAIAKTQVEAFKGNDFAAIQQSFQVLAGEHDNMKGQWEATYSVKINAGKLNGQPVIAGIALSANPSTGSDFIVMADRMAIVSPNYGAGGTNAQLKYPFVVGTVGGLSTVGITGQLLVDGSITADKITTNSLSAITANAGTINGGTFKTHTLNGQGQVVNPLEFRAEISNIGNWPLWIGTGAKSSNNAVMWIDRSGNAMFKGKINAANIVGDFQKRVWINWTGMAQTYRDGSNGTSNSTQYMVSVVEFVLPAPQEIGEAHIPYLDVTVEMSTMTAVVNLYLQVWEGGAWQEVFRREGPYTHLAWSGGDWIRPVMEKHIHFSGFHIPVIGPRTFRIVATSNYGHTGFSSNHSIHAYVTKVRGYIVGLR